MSIRQSLNLELLFITVLSMCVGGGVTQIVSEATKEEPAQVVTPVLPDNVIAGSRPSPWVELTLVSGETVFLNVRQIQCVVRKNKTAFIYTSPDKGFHVKVPMKTVWKMIGRSTGK